MDGFIGEIRAFCYIFDPQGWISCEGQSVPVAQYSALYAVIGNIYGGNNVNFNLPDFRGRTSLAAGAATSQTSARSCGEKVGVQNVTLTANQLPVHSHGVTIVDENAGATDPAGAYWARGRSGGSRPGPTQTYGSAANVPLSSQMIQPAGAASPTGHENRHPFLATRMCICWEGTFPVRE